MMVSENSEEKLGPGQEFVCGRMKKGLLSFELLVLHENDDKSGCFLLL